MSRLLRRKYRIRYSLDSKYGYPLYTPEYKTGFLFFWGFWRDIYTTQFHLYDADNIIATRKLFDKARGYRVS